MDKEALVQLYKRYIHCLNKQDWTLLPALLSENVTYNDEVVGVHGYIQMLQRDFKAIPDLNFNIDKIIADPPYIAARLLFKCSPVGVLFGFAVNGREVVFSENVIYEIDNGRIVKVDSVIDKQAIAVQIE
ncbi:MAG: ester cyclase [Pseudomonadota bacterium]|nr:ester cyclase [Pseudomonadota bacterium]